MPPGGGIPGVLEKHIWAAQYHWCFTGPRTPQLCFSCTLLSDVAFWLTMAISILFERPVYCVALFMLVLSVHLCFFCFFALPLLEAPWSFASTHSSGVSLQESPSPSTWLTGFLLVPKEGGPPGFG